MTISAKILADTISNAGKRLTTMQLRYPRFIHPEELTHRILSTTPEQIIVQTVADGFMYDRDLSRNASSSRAIPVERLIQDIIDDTAMPIHWGKNEPGMQAREQHDAPIRVHHQVTSGGVTKGFDQYFLKPEFAWFDARDRAIESARAFADAGYHKQIVNRLLEPFSHINVVVTATEWDNFFNLRRHEDAQPEIHVLADCMFEVMEASTPALLRTGEWHLPYIEESDWEDHDVQSLIKFSVARCARVSYLTHDGKRPNWRDDLALYERLVGAVPLHASPAEHQATPDMLIADGTKGPNGEPSGWREPHMHGNLVGWKQYRKTIEQ